MFWKKEDADQTKTGLFKILLCSCLCSARRGTLSIFKRRIRCQQKIKVNWAVLTPSFIKIRSGIVTVVTVFR